MTATSTPPEGWDDAVRTWMRIWDRAIEECIRTGRLRARLVARTAERRVWELMSQRPGDPRNPNRLETQP